MNQKSKQKQRILSGIKRLFAAKRFGIVTLVLLVNAFQLAIAAAPAATPTPSAEDLVAATSVKAQSYLENSSRTIDAVITAYSSTPDQTDDTPFVTAAGTTVRDGIVAANFLPLYTKIRIPELFGDKVFVVEDRMHERFSNRVDIWFPDRASAKNFGLKKATIYIL
jgi:3D (Asp-Asp-Asp) domain-containing protein